MSRLTKDDLKNNKYNIFLCMLYSSILAIVYSTWYMSVYDTIGIGIIIASIFILLGILFSYIWTIKTKNEE